ncbi:DUF4274 domain-containing protein [Sphingomonas parva]|uniref:DUF4274 domain-containing protein n=1 Tax=Sphingomonas parva TaxID=2555898 RepID=A0A4Y8ZNI9_9SPHN|nr:DUF4274 domain-containing protein [Sphingomonas parva]TFI56369.1 DUF4274 domain-containing protein [Sphingomonas parva]
MFERLRAMFGGRAPAPTAATAPDPIPAVAPEAYAAFGEEELLAWLQQRGPDDWHRSACSWNWDQDFAPLLWIIRQPECDAGTAITLFARGEPSYYAQFETMAALEAGAGYMMDTVRFLIEICERWAAGQYQHYGFRPDALPHLTPNSLPWPVPDSLAQAEAHGEELDFSGWTEGYPPEFFERG